MDKCDPQILVNNICKNDKQAFNDLFLTYYEKLVQFAFHFLNKTEVAEDIVADIFSNIWMKPGKLSGVYNVEAYLYTSVKNACFDQLRREQKNIQTVDLLTENLSLSDLPMETKELKTLLKNAIAALPEQRRLVFVLVKEHGRKNVEVAEILGISVRTVENQLYKAVKTLANEISRYLGYNPQNPQRNQKGLHLFFFL
jgi:RNA polymerase sigma-70 factor (family 1)